MTAELLTRADNLLKRQHAYDAFENVLRSVDPGLQTDLALYLSNGQMRHREALLACMADREFQLEEPALLEVLRRLLTHDDTRMRRVAALVLFSGGEPGSKVLEEEMGGSLPKEIATDFLALFRLASGL